MKTKTSFRERLQLTYKIQRERDDDPEQVQQRLIRQAKEREEEEERAEHTQHQELSS